MQITATRLAQFHPTKVQIPPNARATRELMKYKPQFSLGERNRRWDRFRKKMLSLDVEQVVMLGSDIYYGMGHANFRYLLQIDSHIGSRAIFPIEGEPVVWTGLSHMNRPTSIYHSIQEWVTDIRDVDEGLGAIAATLREKGAGRGRVGLVTFSSPLVPSSLLHAEYVALLRMLPDVEFIDMNNILADMRITKSEEEIEMLRQAGKIARLTLDAMVNAARPGVPDAAVYAKMIETQIANGGDPNIFNLFSAGPVEHPADELWHLLHGCDQPLMPTMRPLQLGDLIISEFHTKYAGLRCHTEFTVFVGKRAPDQLLRIWEVAQECLAVSREALTPGRTMREAIAMIRAPAERARLDWVELGFHAMGTASPEFPTIVFPEGYGAKSLNGVTISEFVLEEGMTFGNNIDLHDSEWKPDVGCMLSDYMVVRPGGAERLVGVPVELPQVC